VRLFRLDPSSGILWRGSEALPLRAKTAAILCYFIDHPRTVVSRDELREAVWGKKHGNENGPRQCIRELRAAFDDDIETPRFIETVGQRGYRFIGDIDLIETDGSADPVQNAPAPATERSSCVGRSYEIDELSASLSLAQRGGRPICFISGEAGAGKTTLVDRFAAVVGGQKDLWVARGQCTPNYGSREPYGPLLDMAVDLTGGPSGQAFTQLIKKFAPAWLSQLPAIFGEKEASQKRAELIGTGPERMLRELIEILERLSQKTPGLILLEDLHWCDAATLGWIWSWALRRAPARLMIVGTYRPDDVDSESHPLQKVLHELQRLSGFRKLELSGLDSGAVDEYLTERFAFHNFPPQLGAVLYRRTEGHPLFLTATIEDWFARGEVERSEGRWTLRRELADLTETIPASVRALIEHQASRLTDEEHEVLVAASVAGQTFSPATISRRAEDIEATECRCEDIARRRLFIRRTGSTEFSNGATAGTYAFQHVLYQQGLYERVPLATRERLHRQIGLRLEDIHGPRAREIAASLADHFERANDPAKAAIYRRQAGETALQRRDAGEAIDQFRRSLQHLSRCPEGATRDQQELLAQMDLGLGLIVKGNLAVPEIGSVFGRAGELASSLSDRVRLVGATRGQWENCLAQGDLAGMRTICRKLEQILATTADIESGMSIHNILGLTRWFAGELMLTEPHVEAVMKVYQVERHADSSARFGTDPAVQCHMYAAITRQLQGQSEAARGHFAAGNKVAQGLHQPFAMAQALWAGAVIAADSGEVAVARDCASRMVAISEKAHVDFWIAPGHILIGWADATQGDHSGLDRIRRAIAQRPMVARSVAGSYHLALLGDACGRCGLPAEGLSAISDGLALVKTTGIAWYAAELYRLRAVLALQAASFSEKSVVLPAVIRDFHQASAIAASQGARNLEQRAQDGIRSSRQWTEKSA
jgi:DNA-binding winged helix-turn-helix (wHTH) protein